MSTKKSSIVIWEHFTIDPAYWQLVTTTIGPD